MKVLYIAYALNLHNIHSNYKFFDFAYMHSLVYHAHKPLNLKRMSEGIVVQHMFIMVSDVAPQTP